MQDHSVSSDGWDQPEELKNVEPYQNRRLIFHYGKALGIVQGNQYSLEPDMVSGWRPKFPSACPLPLSYHNIYVDKLKKHFQQKKNYKIVYHGERPSNSVKVNQKYSYHWKYRSRYSLNVNSIKQAIANIGVQNDIDGFCLSETPHKFDSSFQSGNLDLVVQSRQNEYNCFLRSDTNTRGHSNWYYFKIENKQQLGTVTLNICNITKAKNLYHQGMKPYCKIGQSGQWSQTHCKNVIFFERLCPYGLPFKTYNLQFCLQFTQAYQQIYVAYGIPYTYSDLQKFVNLLKENEKNYIRVTPLCDSLGGVELPLITVEMNKAKYAKLERSIHRRNNKKKAILITARIHPGQSQSSFLMQGFIQNLLKDKDSLEQILFNQYVFYIVPMVNPDGVIAGNFRTSYSGKDLNRQFSQLDKCIFPQIFAIKELCEKIKNENREIEYFFDFHTHSSKKNMFCYGPEHPQNSIKYYRAKAVAKIMNSMGSIFSYKDSIFTICQQKKNTARAFMLRVMNVPMSFTFEISNGLYLEKNQKLQYLDKNILIEAGGLIYSSLFRYLELDLSSCFRKIIKHKVDNKYSKITVSQSKYSPRSTSKRKSQFRNEITSSIWKNNKLEVGQDWKFKQSKDCTLIELINQIKNEPQNQTSNLEGGSDSEASDEDMTNQEITKLFGVIKQDRKIEQYKAPKFEEIKKIQSEMIRKNRDILVDTLVFPHSKSNKKISQPSKSPFTLLNLKTDSKIPRLKRASRENVKIAVAPKHFTLLI